MGLLGEQIYGKPYREFESRPHRRASGESNYREKISSPAFAKASAGKNLAPSV